MAVVSFCCATNNIIFLSLIANYLTILHVLLVDIAYTTDPFCVPCPNHIFYLLNIS